MSAKDLFYGAGHEFSRAEARAYAREDLIYNVTEDLLVQMEELDVTKQELARRLGKSRSYVTQLLSGARNMTLGSLADICFALGIAPQLGFGAKPLYKQEVELERANEPVWEPSGNGLFYGTVQVLGENVIDMTDPSQWEKVA